MSFILDTLRLRTLQGEASSRSPCRLRDLEFSFQVDIKPTGKDMVVPELCKVRKAPRTEPLGTRIRDGQRSRDPSKETELEQPQREGSEREPGQGDIKREGGAPIGGKNWRLSQDGETRAVLGEGRGQRVKKRVRRANVGSVGQFFQDTPLWRAGVREDSQGEHEAFVFCF